MGDQSIAIQLLTHEYSNTEKVQTYIHASSRTRTQDTSVRKTKIFRTLDRMATVVGLKQSLKPPLLVNKLICSLSDSGRLPPHSYIIDDDTMLIFNQKIQLCHKRSSTLNRPFYCCSFVSLKPSRTFASAPLYFSVYLRLSDFHYEALTQNIRYISSKINLYVSEQVSSRGFFFRPVF
jgi:hypothetical protein